MIARRPLRPDREQPGRGRLPGRGRAPGPRASPSCCSSTWPRRLGSAGSPDSSPRCCRRTGGWPRSSPTPATGSQKGIEDGVLVVRLPDPAHRHLGRGDGAPRAPGRERVDAPAAAPGAGRRATATGRACRAGQLDAAAAASAARSSRVSTDDHRGRGRADRGHPSPTVDGPDRPRRSSRCRPRELGGVVIDAAHKGAHGIVVLTGTDFAGRRQPDGGQPGPRVRRPRARARRARADQHRP